MIGLVIVFLVSSVLKKKSFCPCSFPSFFWPFLWSSWMSGEIISTCLSWQGRQLSSPQNGNFLQESGVILWWWESCCCPPCFCCCCGFILLSNKIHQFHAECDELLFLFFFLFPFVFLVAIFPFSFVLLIMFFPFSFLLFFHLIEHFLHFVCQRWQVSHHTTMFFFVFCVLVGGIPVLAATHPVQVLMIHSLHWNGINVVLIIMYYWWYILYLPAKIYLDMLIIHILYGRYSESSVT